MNTIVNASLSMFIHIAERKMNCINCGAPMKLLLNRQHFFCDHCTSIYFPEKNKDGIRILEESSRTKCPICNVPLVYGFVDNTQLLYCLKLQGKPAHTGHRWVGPAVIGFGKGVIEKILRSDVVVLDLGEHRSLFQ